jgi:replicative DNA helicase
MSSRRITSEIIDRQPPVDLSAEKGVLGSILLLPEICDELALAVGREDFYDEANGLLFGELMAMHDAGKRIDLTLLTNRLKKTEDYERIGGAGYLAELTQSVPHAANALHYAEIVRATATLRGLIHVSSEILRSAYEDHRDAREALNAAEEAILSVRDRHGCHLDRLTDIVDVLRESLDGLQARMEGSIAFGLQTGFADLDKKISLRNGELVIIAARPSMGKTALAANIAIHVASKVPVLFVSLEMERIALADRLLSAEAHIDSYRMQQGDLNEGDRRSLVEAAAAISALDLAIDDSPSRTMTEISAVARRLKRKRKSLGLVIVDYLQLIESDDPKAPREQQVAKIASRLKHLARELSCPVLCLAQLNRGSEAKADKKPELANLRESGAIEQDADVVMFVHRDEYYHPEDESAQGWADILVKKNRNGPTGDVELIWQARLTRFCNAATKRQRSVSRAPVRSGRSTADKSNSVPYDEWNR